MLQHLLLLVSAVYIISPALGSFQYNTYTYKTVGNLSIQADVYVPSNTVQAKYPVVLAIHGGAYIGGSKLGGCSEQELEEMLSRGWCVVSIDYRLAPDVYLDDIVQDVQDAYAWIRTELVKIVPLDLDSIIVLGDSAGGGLAVISGYMLSPRPQAIIAFYPGFTNFTDAVSYNDSSPVPQLLVKQLDAIMEPVTEYNMGDWSNINDPRVVFFYHANDIQKLGWMLATHDPTESVDYVLEYLRNYSVVYHIDSNYPPTALIHGFDDTLVPHQQSVQMAEYLAEANVPYRLNLVPGAGHVFDFGDVTTQVWDDYILTAFDFVEQFLNTNSTANVTIYQ